MPIETNQRLTFKRPLCIIVLSITWLLSSSGIVGAAESASQSDVLLFPALHYDILESVPQQLNLKEQEFFARTSAFYAKDIGPLRFLSEFFLSDDELEIERLQIGWCATEHVSAWAGRFHAPIGFWNQEYHHGAYLVTSVTRPGIVEFEDDGGILPTHLTGLLLDGQKAVRNSIWEYTLAVGYAPKITVQGLEPLNLADPSISEHKLTTAIRLSYQPKEFGPIKLGLFYMATTLNSEIVSTNKIKQNVAGAYFYGEWRHWKVTSAYFVLNNRIKTTASNNRGSFTNEYLQIDHMFNETWTIFGRVEDSENVENDPYLSFFPNFVTSRALLGVRYDFLKRHAITFEFGEVGVLDESYHHMTAQWSAVFP